MLTTTRAPESIRRGKSCCAQCSMPGPCSPTLLIIPPGVSCTLGAGLPGQGSALKRLDDNCAETRQIDIPAEFVTVTSSARRGHDRVGKRQRANPGREVDRRSLAPLTTVRPES